MVVATPWLALLVVLAGVARANMPAPCSDAWCRSIEARVPTGDGQGHGPDPCSDEWKSVVERKLGMRNAGSVPNRDSAAWCRAVDRLVGSGPSYRCGGVEPGGIEAMICGDAELSALDRRLADVYAEASKKAANERPKLLPTEQRGWIKGRDDCWKSADERGCVRDEYRRRIAELQARYRLVTGTGPIRFVCDGDPRNEVVVTFVPTDPRTLIAERGDQVSLMYVQPSGSGTTYQGRNETFWEHQGEASIAWGHEAPTMRCVKAP